jgi:hypothetical protein
MMKLKGQPLSPLPDGVVRWTAKFTGTCVCGKQIRKGQPCFYDKRQRKLICPGCGKLPAATMETLRRPAACGKVMDRVKQIFVMPKPLPADVQDELSGLLIRLRTEMAADYSARRLLMEVMQVPTSDDVICIAMKYGENCHGCGSKQSSGTAAIWCRSSHRIWCLECHSARKL